MFGDKLTKEECSKLITQLQACGDPFHCAHGEEYTLAALTTN